MQRVSSGNGHLLTLILAAALGALAFAPDAVAAEPLPDVNVVTRRMLERAQLVARGGLGAPYTFNKRALTEHLDPNDKTVKSEERLYEGKLVSGFPFSRLVKIQGRDLTDEELKKEEQREERLRQRLTSVDPKKMVARKEAWVTEKLLERFVFTVQERVLLNGRPTLVLAFKSKGEKSPAKNIMERVFSHTAGKVWMDEADGDAARLSSSLLESFSVGWFGMLGSLHQCDLLLERQRMADGVWVNVRQTLQIHYRKVAATTHVRTTEECSAFKKAGPES